MASTKAHRFDKWWGGVLDDFVASRDAARAQHLLDSIESIDFDALPEIEVAESQTPLGPMWVTDPSDPWVLVHPRRPNFGRFRFGMPSFAQFGFAGPRATLVERRGGPVISTFVPDEMLRDLGRRPPGTMILTKTAKTITTFIT